MLPNATYVVVNLARQIQPGDVVFTGVNSAIPTAACLLAKRCYTLTFTHLNVAGGVDARPRVLPASSGDPSLLDGTAAIFNNEDFYDLCLRGGVDIAFLGAAQIDATGHVNVSAIGDWHSPKVRLPGGGGAATMMPTARRSVVWLTRHSARGLVEKVDFATAGGATTLVTPSAVFERKRDQRFRLVSYRSGMNLDEVSAATGFSFDSSGAGPTADATPDELRTLEELDELRVLDRIFARRTAAASHPTSTN
jgi:glutaconate CoA-transferase, subunit B